MNFSNLLCALGQILKAGVQAFQRSLAWTRLKSSPAASELSFNGSYRDPQFLEEAPMRRMRSITVQLQIRAARTRHG